MGSTSEPYQNGTNVQNVVVYVANENVQSIQQQQQQQQYLSSSICSTEIYISNNNDRLVYSQCAQYRSPSVTLIDDSNISVKGILKPPEFLHNISVDSNVYNISSQNGSHDAAVFISNANKMYENTTQTVYKEHVKPADDEKFQSDDGKQTNAIISNCCTSIDNEQSTLQLPPSNETNLKSNDIVVNIPNFTTTAATGLLIAGRSDSVRVGDSFTSSGCSSGSVSSFEDGANDCTGDEQNINTSSDNNKETFKNNSSTHFSDDSYVRVNNTSNVLNNAIKKVPSSQIKRIPFVSKIIPSQPSIAAVSRLSNTCSNVSETEAVSIVRTTSPLNTISVPVGWKRLNSNGTIIYVSPSNTALTSLDRVKSYLLTEGTCKCGLECPVQCDIVFNFDPKVATRPYIGTPCSNSSAAAHPGDLTKLCNHKRKSTESWPSSFQGGHSQNQIQGHDQSQGPFVTNSNCLSSPNIAYDPQQHQQPLLSPSQPHQAPSPLPNSAIASRQLSNHCKSAVVKNYAFDVSDRKKKRKIPQPYSDINAPPVSPQSPHVMVYNPCEISAKENNSPSLISQSPSSAYTGRMDMVNIIGQQQQQMNMQMGSAPPVRMKQQATFVHSGYQNQNYFNPPGVGTANSPANYSYSNNNSCYQPQNNCSDHRTIMQDASINASNIYMHSSENYNSATAPGPSPQMTNNFVCNQIKTSAGGQLVQQQSCNNVMLNQQHRLAFGIPTQQPQHATISISTNGNTVTSNRLAPCSMSENIPTTVATGFTQQSQQQLQQFQQHQMMHVATPAANFPAHHHHHHTMQNLINHASPNPSVHHAALPSVNGMEVPSSPQLNSSPEMTIHPPSQQQSFTNSNDAGIYHEHHHHLQHHHHHIQNVQEQHLPNSANCAIKISPASNSCRMNEDSSVYCDCYQNNNNNNNSNHNNNSSNSNSNNNNNNSSNSNSSSSSSSNSSATNNKLNNLTSSPCNDRAECSNYTCPPSATSMMVPAAASQNHMLMQHNDQQPFIVQDHQNSVMQSQQQFQQQHQMISQQTAQLHPNTVHIQQPHQQQHYQLQQHMQQQHQLQHDIMHQNLEMKNKNQMLQQSTHIVQHPSAIQVQSLPSTLENVEEMQRSNEFLISSQQQPQQHSQHNINVSPAANVHHYQRSSTHVWQQQNRINNGNINDNNHNVVTTASSNVIVPSVASAGSNDSPSPVSSPYERVPPLHPHVSPGPASWNDEPPRKKYNRTTSKSPTTASALRKPRSPYNNSNNNSNNNNCIGSSNNVNDVNRNSNHALQHINSKLSSLSDSHNNEYVSHVVPSFMDDPNGYLAQQTALLNSTISKQTGVSLCTSNERNPNVTQQYKFSYNNSSANSNPNNNANSSNNNSSNRPTTVPCSSSAVASNHNKDDGVQYGVSGAAANTSSRKIYINNNECRLQSRTPDSSVNSDYSQRQTAQQQQSVGTSTAAGASKMYVNSNFPSSSEKPFVSPDGSPVTSSTYTDSREYNPASVSSSDSRSPIQAGTVSTSNQSPVQPGISSPNICSGGPSSVNSENYSSYPATPVMQESTIISAAGSPKPQEMVPYHAVVTTMASGHTYSSNTITSVLAGKTNTALVTVNNSNDIDNSGANSNHTNIDSSNNMNNDTIADITIIKENNALIDAKGSGNSGNNKANIGNNNTNSVGINKIVTGNSIIINNASTDSGNSTGNGNKCGSIRTQFVSSPLPNSNEIISSKSPLEMVQNVVSSIQIPQQHPDSVHSSQKTQLNTQNLQGSHILVSSNGQLIVATSNTVASQNIAKVHTSIPLIHSSATSSSSIVTNVTGSQMIPTMGVAQQVLGQPTVVVNTLPNGQLVFHQPSVMTAVDGTTTVQIPQLAVAATAGNVTSQNLTENNNTTTVTLNTGSAGPFSPRNQNNLTTANALDPSKRKINSGRKRKLSPHLLQISQPASGTASVVVQQQPQTQTSFTQPAQMLQTLTILPNKNTAQFTGAQPLIATANVLQPINFVQNVPTIQQFIVPAGLGGMVMATGDGTATLLPDAVQLNVLTPVQNPTAGTAVFGHTGGQSIIATGPATGMVIRTQPSNPQNTLTAQLRPQTISTATGQFITAQSPNQFIVNNSNFSGQLSPIVASVSPNQSIHSFSASPNNNNSSMNSVRSNSSQAQEFIHCGPALVVPCSVSQTSSPQNTTVVQQNTTIVQQQMTMVSNNQQLPDQSSSNHSANANNSSGTPSNVISSNLTPHNIILNDSKQSQNFIITTDNKSPSTHHPQTSYILSSPKSGTADKPTATAAGTHFILNNLNGEKQTQSFIISSSPSNGSEKQLCGNFILTTNSSEKTSSAGNFIIASSPSTAQNTRFTRQSVSTQTAAAAAAAANPQVLQISSTPTLFVAAANNNNTFSTSATTTAYIGSPPDTTTHSPINSSSGQSPDTPSSSSLLVGSTDDVSSSPTSSTPNMSCSSDNMQTRQPMVHCISSSNVVDWTDGNGIEEKKLKIIVDHGTPEIIATGMDVFSPIASLQARYERQKYDFSSTSLDGKESISFIESSTFEESTIHK